MKVYFLRFDVSDLTLDEGMWVTPTIDLYDNDQYTNYSTYKSSYGLGGERFTWAGLKRNSSIGATDFEYFTLPDLQSQDSWGDFETDTALVQDGRVIDLTARIDLVSFTINLQYDAAKLYAYVSPDNDDTHYSEEWFRHGGIRTNELLDALDVERYAKFAFELSEDPTAEATPTFEALVRIEIHDPVVSPLHRFTRAAVRNFPQWMDMHHVPEESSTPTVTEPETVGAQFLNAVIGEGLDESYRKLYYYRDQAKISTVDLNQVYQAYRTTAIPDRIYSIEAGEGATPVFIEPAVAGTYEEFLSHPGEDVVFIDYNQDTLYSIKEYTTLKINGEVYPQSIYRVFNFLDDLGMKVDLYRIDGESNENFQKRILDVYRNKPGSGIEQFKLALRRELDLWRTEGATPDSDYVGATPTVLEIEDILEDPEYFDSRGLPKEKFIKLIDELSRRYPATWGRFVWGEALWDIAGEGGAGYGVIPYQYDATPVTSSARQPGVGDGDDLLIHRPDADTGPEDYAATLKVKGLEKTLVDEYTAIEFDLYSQPVGTYESYDNPTTTLYFTVEATTNEPNTYYASFEMSATSDYSGAMATPSTTEQSWAFEEIFSKEEATTHEDLTFRNKTNDIPYGLEGSGIVPMGVITSAEVLQGRWDVGAGSYADVEGSDTYKAWLSHDEATYLEQPTATQLTLSSAVVSNERPELGLESKQVASPVTTEWRGDRVDYSVVLNGIPPYTEQHPKTLNLQSVVFDPHVSNRKIELGLTTEDSGTYGGLTRDDKGNEIFIEDSFIHVDDDNVWTSGIQELPESTTSVVLSTEVDAATPNSTYPVENTTWEAFEAYQTVPFSGIADVNGPWIDGTAPKEGNTNLNAHVYDSLERSDFGVADTDDYIIQRMEVSSDNERVITHLESNVVASAIQEDEITNNPPPNAIVEKYDSNADVYYFEPFYLKARARRGPTKDWKPQINTGFFYTRDNDYYLFAKPETLTTSGTELELGELARQGAPLIVKDGSASLRQVAFFDEETLQFTFTNTETIEGNGTSTLYASYQDLYDVALVDENGDSVSVTSTTTGSNQITTSAATIDGHEYEASYKLRDSFYVDHDHLDSNNIPKSIVHFDSSPDTEYSVTYETSDLKETSFADVALNPAYTSQTEGFIFVSDNEYEYAGIDFYMSPSSLVADGKSFAVLTFYAYDEFGNPKANQGIEISANYGDLSHFYVVTDTDGFAYSILYSENIDEVDYVPTVGEITYSATDITVIDGGDADPQVQTSTVDGGSVSSTFDDTLTGGSA